MAIPPALQFGPAVEDHLRREGALAQAVDPNTILVSSALLRWSPFDRRMVLLHELAHLRQLASPGNDPVRCLEEEAWDAARSWMEGRPFRIRGRANRPLNALAIVQGGPKGHPFAPPWYRSSPVEPIGNKSAVTVEDSTLLDDMTLETIFDRILAAKPTEVVLVCHGSGDGLAIPLRKGSTGGARKESIVFLAADRQGEEETMGGKVKTPAKSDKEVSDLTGLAEGEAKGLRARMNQVRDLKLKHVAFRACNLGISPDSMKAFRDLFGAASVSAPVEFDSYAHFSPSIGDDLEGWVKVKRRAGFHVSVEGAVAFGTKPRPDPTVYDIVARAASKDAFRAWVRKHVAEGAWGTDGLVYHGVEVRHPLGLGAPSIYFIRDEAFVANIVFKAG